MCVERRSKHTLVRNVSEWQKPHMFNICEFTLYTHIGIRLCRNILRYVSVSIRFWSYVHVSVATDGINNLMPPVDVSGG